MPTSSIDQPPIRQQASTSLESNPSITQPAANPSSTKKPSHIQEKMMLLIGLMFFGGIVLYTVLPEGPVRGIGIGLFSLGIFYLLTRIR